MDWLGTTHGTTVQKKLVLVLLLFFFSFQRSEGLSSQVIGVHTAFPPPLRITCTHCPVLLISLFFLWRTKIQFQNEIASARSEEVRFRSRCSAPDKKDRLLVPAFCKRSNAQNKRASLPLFPMARPARDTSAHHPPRPRRPLSLSASTACRPPPLRPSPSRNVRPRARCSRSRRRQPSRSAIKNLIPIPTQ